MIVLGFPLACMVDQHDALGFHTTLHVGHRPATDCPLSPETLPRDQDAGAVQPANVERARVFSGALRAEVPVLFAALRVAARSASASR